MGSSILLVQSSGPSQTLLSGIHWSESPHWNSPSLQRFVGSAEKKKNLLDQAVIISLKL